MDEKYWIIVRTGEAEKRAIEYCSKEILKKIVPVIEITRGRKITKENVISYPFEKRLNVLKQAFANQIIAIDVTSEDALSSAETDFLYSTQNGYKNWIDFLKKKKKENVFQDIVPAILMNFDDDDFEYNLLKEIDSLKSNFNSLLYRNDIADENCYDDLELFCDRLNGVNLNILIDCGYIPQASYHSVAEKCIARISNLKSMSNLSANYIVGSTSFPNNVKDLGDCDTDTFRISEIDIYDQISKEHNDVVYADYASINPIRNDNVVMSRGWIPRIDVPLDHTVFYYRQRRPKGVTAYASTYTYVAKRACLDKRFPYVLRNNWGIQQILLCSKGAAPSSAPSFWISVRMNIHIEQQVARIYSI